MNIPLAHKHCRFGGFRGFGPLGGTDPLKIVSRFPFLAFGLMVMGSSCVFAADDVPFSPFRVSVPGKLRLHLREQTETASKSGQFETRVRVADWNVAETAIIVCDMWEDHPCKMAAHRVDVMAPEMNRVISAARSHGVQVIHAPSGGMQYYDATPQRQRIKAAPTVQPPVPIEKWCYHDPAREADYPIPYIKGRGDCDDPVLSPDTKTSKRQHPAIKIVGFDAVSDQGDEVFNFLEQLGIKNVIIMGVHTQYCVLGRPFGIRQMVRLGKNVALCRDLTDALYNPLTPPYVSHERGTELMVEHIEKYWCPSIVSSDLLGVVSGSAHAASRAPAQ
jgi:nicotinamidase-related amidase